MTMTDLGAAFAKKGNGELGGILESLVAGIRADVLAELRGGQKPPVVNVSPPLVSVAAPNVTVTPSITVEPNKAPVINVEVPGLVEMARGLAEVHADLQALLTLLGRPVTKTVERGSGGLIASVLETR